MGPRASLMQGPWESFLPHLIGKAAPATLALIVPPSQPLARGLEFAEDYRHTEKSLWIFGHGITLPGRAPGWAGRSGVTLVELGALYPADEISATSSHRAALTEAFRQLLPTQEYLTLLSSAYTRFLYQTMESLPLIEGADKLAKSTRVLWSDPTWPLGHFQASRQKNRLLTWARLALLTTGGLLLALARTARESWSRRPLMADLQRRRQQQSGPSPALWLTVHHEWFRFNPHLIDSFGLTQLKKGTPPGILFQGDLLPGVRDHFTLKRQGKEFYQGLGPLIPYLDQLHLDQVVVPEGVRGFASAVVRTVRSAALVLFQLARNGDNPRLSVANQISSWAKLLSIDLLRANLARQATAEAIERNQLQSKSLVINYGAQAAGPVAADLRLQEAGLRTVDFCHGAGVEVQIPLLHTSSSLATTWTEVDAKVLQRLGYPAIAAGMPVRIGPGSQKGLRQPIRVLLASNYAHRDTAIGGFYPLSEFHHYLAGLPDLLAAKNVAEFHFRWRPHPADSPDEIKKALGNSVQALELSSNALAADLEWSDLIVTSLSSLFFEALLSNRPVFVQVLPRFRATQYAQAIDWRRRFFYLEEGVEQIISQLAGTSPGTEPEAAMRRAFFGETGWPVGQEAILGRAAL